MDEPILPRRLRGVDSAVNAVTADIVDSAIEVQRELGTGLLEKAYEAALAHELALRRRGIRTQVPIHVLYKGARIRDAYALDLEVDGRVAVELKVVDHVLDEHLGQLATYLRFGGYPVGLLVNFRASPLKLGIHRVINPWRAGGPRDPTQAQPL